MKTEKSAANSFPDAVTVNFNQSLGTLEIYQHGADQPAHKCMLDYGLALTLAIQLHDVIASSPECMQDQQYRVYREKCKKVE